MHESQSYYAECKPDTKDYRSVVAWEGDGQAWEVGLQGGRRILDNGDTNYFYGDDGFLNVHLCQNLSNCIFKYVQCIIICQIILPLRYLGIFLCFFKGYILFNSINMIYM